MPPKLKVALVTNFPTVDGHYNGGVEAASDLLAQGLHETGDAEIHVIAPGKRREYQVEQRPHCVEHWLPRFRLPGIARFWTIERWYIQNIVARINPTIVHFQGALGWSLGCKHPYICTIHCIA